MNTLIKNMSVEEVIKREFFKKGRTQKSIANGLGISQSTVSQIVNENIMWAIRNNLINLTPSH